MTFFKLKGPWSIEDTHDLCLLNTNYMIEFILHINVGIILQIQQIINILNIE